MIRIKLSSQKEFCDNTDEGVELLVFKINDNKINDYIEGKEVFKTDIVYSVKNEHDNCTTIDFKIIDELLEINEEGWYILIFKIKNKPIFYKVEHFIPCYMKKGDTLKFM